MAQAQGRATTVQNPAIRAEELRDVIARVSAVAIKLLPRNKIEATISKWLSGVKRPPTDGDFADLLHNATMMAMALALFAPSLSGQTAIDRFARQRKATGPDDAAAIEALRRSRFRLFSLEKALPPFGFQARDLATGETLHVIDGGIPARCVGLSIAARLCPVDGDIMVPVGPTTPLDDAMLTLARQWIRPNGRGLAAQRCSEALYRHAVRHGAPRVPGLNSTATATEREEVVESAPRTFPFGPGDGPLHHLAFTLSRSGAAPTAAEIQSVRAMSSSFEIVTMIIAVAAARHLGAQSLATAYEALALIQMETVERRAASGLPGSLNRVMTMLAQAMASGDAPPTVMDLFDDLRRRVSVTSPRQKTTNSDLDKVLGRIQALREKTVDRGCTEQEALLAAEKVAELLDRYGLSLSEVELKDQTCEGASISTGRKRTGPVDTCITAVGRFCDCRVWREKMATGEIHYVFFGLPADVAGARYLYDLVMLAFETETEMFKAGPLYAGHHSGERRSATNSFQLGLAYGIATKLDTLHETREASMRTSTGRDLVPIKEAIVEDELAKLGMTFTTRVSNAGKRVLSDAYHAGIEAGDRFEYRPGIEQGE
ncbi:MAG: DUF2786 domain-containing protein [Alphaproteobacteria bacterium]